MARAVRGLASFNGFLGRAVVNVGPSRPDRANLPSKIIVSRAESRTRAKEHVGVRVLGGNHLLRNCSSQPFWHRMPVSGTVFAAGQDMLSVLVIGL